jgi:uncharacterized protein YggE
MQSGRNRLWVALGSVAAVALLLAAFVVVWLMPRGPQPGTAGVQTPGVGSTNAGTSDTKYAPLGAPSMAPISDQPNISVHGMGTISAKPDMATIQAGVQIQNTSLDAAQSEAATKMDTIINQLKAAGIDEKDIATSQYNVEPVMNYRDNQPPEITGYRVTNMVSAKIRDITKAGKTIDDLVKSGANSVYGISFGFSDPTALMRQAREQAVADARAKAEQLAQLNGVALGAVIQVVDGGQNMPVPVMQAAMDMAAERGMAAAPASPINPGQQEVRADVNIVYSIK